MSAFIGPVLKAAALDEEKGKTFLKILVLSESLPLTLHDGGNLRIFHLMRGMARMGHEIDLAAFVPGDPVSHLGPLADICSRVDQVSHGKARRWMQAGLGVFSPVPANVSAYSNHKMSALIEALHSRKSYDIVLSYRLRMAPYALNFEGPKILDLTDSMTLFSDRARKHAGGFWTRIVNSIEHKKFKVYEILACKPFAKILMTSAIDAGHLGLAASQCTILPNGVDLTNRPFHPLESRSGIIFMGNLSYGPNREAGSWLAKKIFPAVRRQMPGCTLRFVGPGADKRWCTEGVSIIGPVEDLVDELSRARVLVVPMSRGAGVQNKILDALASGLPVVATPLAASGLGLERNKEYLPGSNTDELVSQTLRVLADDKLAESLADAGRAIIEKSYIWDNQWKILEEVLQESRACGKSKK